MLNDLAQELHTAFREAKKTLSVAESCTGGAIAASLTAIPGASEFFQGSLVVYSDAWKGKFLDVSKETLQKKGAVSLETVKEMVQGLLQKTDSDVVAAVSGVAGPTGQTPQKPVGTVYFAIGLRGEAIDAGKLQFKGNRASVIQQTVDTMLRALWRRVAQGKRTFST